MNRLTALLACCIFLAAPGLSLAEEANFEKLENELWKAAKDLNWPKLKSMIALGYQEVDQAGRRELKAALKDTKTENMSDFKLTDFKVTRNGPTAVVTYYAAVAETIAGKRLPRQKAPRASIWIKTGEGWKTIFHADCNPVDQ